MAAEPGSSDYGAGWREIDTARRQSASTHHRRRGARCIGAEHRNRWWENAVMGVLFALALYGAVSSVRSIRQFLT